MAIGGFGIPLIDAETTDSHRGGQVQHDLKTINHQPSTINHQPSTINHQPSTINQQPTTNNQQPTTNNQQPTTNNQQPTTNNQQPTMDIDLEKNFKEVVKTLSIQFGDDMDIQAVLFLIGVQELGKGPMKFSKNAKLDVMHIAICTLLTPYGYYEYEGMDKDGWPHWKTNEKLPPLKPGQQLQLMKQAIVDYFKNKELVN